MNRRQMIMTSAMGVAGFATCSAFTAPACDGVSKDKAVKFAGLVIDLSKEAIPLIDLLGARDIASAFSEKVIPVLGRLKDALAKADIPEAGTLLKTVRNALSATGTALLNLPDSPRRTTIIGILASINILLLTVEAFVESEAPVAIGADLRSSMKSRSTDKADAILRTYEATRL